MSVSEAPSNSIRRRPRPILSCLECRRKKLGCDRQTPCNQCVKAERAELCSYEAPRKSQRTSIDTQTGEPSSKGQKSQTDAGSRPGLQRSASPSDSARSWNASTAQAPQPTAITSVGIIEDLQQRIARLESAIAHRPAPASPGWATLDDHPSEQAQEQAPSYYGAQYAPFASKHRLFLFEPFTEAKKFLVSMPGDPSMKPYVDRLRRWNEQHLAANGGSLDQQDADGAVTRMLALLPPRDDCDELVRAYFANSERTLRVLHRPNFMKLYERFSQARTGDTDSGLDVETPTPATNCTGAADAAALAAVPDGFVPQLIVVLAASCNTDRLYGHRIRTTSLAAPASKAALCELVQTWLDRLKRTERMRLDTLQTQVILTLCQHNIFLPNDVTWQATGALVRRAMLLGLHRDPSEAGDHAPLDAELRRRLWATVLEMDLQASMVWGMPAAVSYANYNTRPPANLDDDDLSAGMTQAPTPNAPDQWSDTLLQNILARSLPVRLRVGSFLNDVRQDLDPERRQRLGREIEELVANVPAVALPNMYEPVDSGDRPGRLLGRILLDLSLRRVLLYLYRPFAMHIADTEIFYRARRICRDSALAILSHKDAFQPQTAAGDFDGDDAAECWTLFSTTCRHDVLLAALSLCWEIRMMSSARGHEVGESRGLGGGAWTKNRLTRVAEDAIASLMQHGDMSTNFLKDVVGCSIILESVKFQGSEAERVRLLRTTLADILEKVLSRLEGSVNGNEAGTLSCSYSQMLTNHQSTEQALSPSQEDVDMSQYFGSFNLEFVSLLHSAQPQTPLMSKAPP